jgi:branched-chain amino acid transport system substrate-binding protein
MLKTLVPALSLALAAAACSGGGGAGPANAKVVSAGGTVVIGATLSLTGSLGPLGSPLEAGYAQEIANVNASGGIAVGGTKEKLKLVVLDNRGDPGTAGAQALQLVRQDHAVALLRHRADRHARRARGRAAARPFPDVADAGGDVRQR